MYGRVEILASVDPFGRERACERVARHAELVVVDGDREVLVRALVARRHLLESDAGGVAEVVLIERSKRAPPFEQSVESSERLERHGGVELRHARVEPGELGVVVARIAVVASDPKPLGNRVVVRGDETAFARDKNLCRCETEYLGRAEPTDRYPACGCAQRMCGIEDQRHAVGRGQLGHTHRVTWCPEYVRRYEGLRALEQLFRMCKVELKRLPRALGECGRAAVPRRRVRGCREREARHDHASRSLHKGLDNQHESGCARADGNDVAHAEPVRDAFFELGDERSVGEHAPLVGGLEAPHEVFERRARRSYEWNPVRERRRAAEKCGSHRSAIDSARHRRGEIDDVGALFGLHRKDLLSTRGHDVVGGRGVETARNTE